MREKLSRIFVYEGNGNEFTVVIRNNSKLLLPWHDFDPQVNSRQGMVIAIVFIGIVIIVMKKKNFLK